MVVVPEPPLLFFLWVVDPLLEGCEGGGALCTGAEETGVVVVTVGAGVGEAVVTTGASCGEGLRW
jgi:hypothetical protein